MAKIAGCNTILTTSGFKRIDELVPTDIIISNDGTTKTIHTIEKSSTMQRMYKLGFRDIELIMPQDAFLMVSGLVWREKPRLKTISQIWDFYRSYELSGKRRHNLYIYKRNMSHLSLTNIDCRSEYYIAGTRLFKGTLPFKTIPQLALQIPDTLNTTIVRDKEAGVCGFSGYDHLQFNSDQERLEYIKKIILMDDLTKFQFVSGVLDSSTKYKKDGAISASYKHVPKDSELQKYYTVLLSSLGFWIWYRYWYIYLYNHNKNLQFGCKNGTHQIISNMKSNRKYWYEMIATIQLDIKDYYYELLLNDTDVICLGDRLVCVPNI